MNSDRCKSDCTVLCHTRRQPSTSRLQLAVLLVPMFTILLAPFTASAQRPLGTDVSGYQPTITWSTVESAGVAFAWSKATEGTGYVNPYFTSQENGAKGVGIFVGAYHFARPSSHPNITGASSADSEAAYFWSVASNYVNLSGSYLVPMLDWEDPLVTNQLSAATMSAWVNEWCNSVSNSARLNGIPGVRPVVYTGTWYSRPSSTYSGLTTAVTNWSSWIAAYPTSPNPQTGAPSDTYPWPTWNIWQYADTNWSGGDADVFNGTLAKFVQMFVIGGTNFPSITTDPRSLAVTPGSSATFSVKASGQAPLGFQWRFNGTPIPGATASTYTIGGAQMSSIGGYSVVVSNSLATVSSATAYLTVLVNAPGAVLAPAGLVDWWPADGTPSDIFGGFITTPNNGFSYTTGEQDRAFHFDGSTSYLAVSGAASVSAPWTACMWVNRQNAPGTGAALLGDGTYELKLEQYNGTRQVGVTKFGTGDYTFGYIVPAGVWTHLAFVSTSTGTTLFVNGVLQSTLTNNLPLPRSYIGAGYVTSSARFVDFMLGGLDEIMLFNRALSSAEINAIYSAGSTGFVRAPEFTGQAPLGSGQFGLNLRGMTGKTFTIYSSQDLAAWTRQGTVVNPTGATQYIDNNATNAQTYYRASQP